MRGRENKKNLMAKKKKTSHLIKEKKKEMKMKIDFYFKSHILN